MIIFLLCFLIPSSVWTAIVPKTKAERFFDFDKNGVLSTYESRLLQTHRYFGWPLANSKSKKEFDFNQDGMLEPQELEKYEKAKKERPLRIWPNSSSK